MCSLMEGSVRGRGELSTCVIRVMSSLTQVSRFDKVGKKAYGNSQSVVAIEIDFRSSCSGGWSGKSGE